MALNRSMGARKDATRGTTALEVRKGLLQGLFTSTGVVAGAASPPVSGDATMAYKVSTAHFVTQRAAGDGYHLVYNDGDVLVGNGGVGTTVGAAPGVGLQRIDIIWVRQRSASENADTTSEPDFGVTSGTAAASPVAPTIPTGALELARNTMTDAATSTASTGNTITQTATAARIRGTGTPFMANTRAASYAIGTNSDMYILGGSGSSVPVFGVPSADTTLTLAGGAYSNTTFAWYPASGVLVPLPATGLYEIEFRCKSEPLGSGTITIGITKNSTAIDATAATLARDDRANSAAVSQFLYAKTPPVRLTSSDSLRFIAFIFGAAGALTIANDPNTTFFSIKRAGD